MAKASAAGATHYVPEGGEVPDLPGVRLVGPGAPIHDALRRRLAEAQAAAAVEQSASEPGPADSGEDTAAAAGEAAGEAAAEQPQPQDTGNGDEDDGPADYASYPKTVLVDLCRERGLPVTGTKAELAARLAGYDKEQHS